MKVLAEDVRMAVAAFASAMVAQLSLSGGSVSKDALLSALSAGLVAVVHKFLPHS